MQTQNFNPDARPLPAGWTQHFEPMKHLWYYVQTNVMPPKVSFTHPADIVIADRNPSPYQMPQPQPQPPRNPTPSGPLTFAQKLYASSVSSSLSPMINPRSVSQPPTYQPPRNLPTPPPSNSPPPGTGAHFPNPPSVMPPISSQSPYPLHQTPSHIMNHPLPNANSTPSSAPLFSNSHRSNTFQTPSTSNDHSQRLRASTYDQAISQHSVKANSPTPGSRPTRHLVTMARPPDQQSSSDLSPLGLEPPASVYSAPVVPSPPPSSILFSQTDTALASPLTPPPFTAVQSTPMTTTNISSVLSVPSGTAYMPQSNMSPLGRVASGPTIQTVGGVGVGSLADGVVIALQSVLLTPGTGIDQLSLQAVIQKRPDADYQRMINALIKLHQQQQQQFSLMKLQSHQLPSTAIDYQALITEVQRLQAQQVTIAQQQQQQQLAQLHANAQLQAAQQQQQQQTAAQQYQALIQQQYQQQTAIQQQQQQILAQQQQQQQQQATQYQALLQQRQVAAQAQQNPASLAYARPAPQQFQQHRPTLQSTAQTLLGIYTQFQHLNHQSSHGSRGGNANGGEAPPSFDPTSLYSTGGDSGGGDNGGGGGGGGDNGGGGTGLFDSLSQAFGGNGGQDSSGGVSDFLSSSFSQDNSGGFDMSNVDMSGQYN